MTLSSHELLTRLGNRETIYDVSTAAGWTRRQFDRWWRDECAKRVPTMKGAQRVAGPSKSIRIDRGRWGIPHVFAENDRDLFFGFGYAVAQDRLFQLEYLRRKARGTLAEVVGPDAVESDLLARTVGLGGIAEAEWPTLPGDVQELLTAYTAGINALMEASRENLPIEFDLLGYAPAPWLPTDSLAIEGEFRWYLTGRFPVIVIPELAKRTLGDGAHYEAFLQGEADDESVMHRGEYSPGPGAGRRNGAGGEGPGSNNWVLSGKRTVTGQPLLASDPHVPFFAVSIWHEVRLRGGSFDVAGVALAGMPGVMIGRNRRVAWGITNNICSLRDLYQEKIDAAHPGCFLYKDRWEPEASHEEIIAVKGAAAVHKTIRASRNGPIVDEILPAAARGTGPVSLRWVGFEPCGWLTATIGMNRAANCAEFRQAARPWAVPTFNLVYADVDGHVGYQCVGRLPIRGVGERGYRPGWDPQHQWQGYIPFEALPHLSDPPRGYVITANNRTAPDDYPYPLSGTWSSGYRAERIRAMLEQRSTVSREDCQAMQLDVHSGRAALVVPALVNVLGSDADPRVRQAVELLKKWDCTIRHDSPAPALFNVFFTRWSVTVASERFSPETASFVAANAGGLALRLLEKDELGWFQKQLRKDAIRAAFVATLDELTTGLGRDMSGWHWGSLHTLMQKHFLSGRGDLGKLLDRSGLPLHGDAHTVYSGTYDASYRAWLGAGYRMVADLADPQAGLWAIEVGGASGHPGSPHYDDQLEPWSAGKFHYLALAGDEVEGERLTLEPI